MSESIRCPCGNSEYNPITRNWTVSGAWNDPWAGHRVVTRCPCLSCQVELRKDGTWEEKEREGETP